MPQDLKCFFWFHKYDKPEIVEVKNKYEEVVRRIYVCRCANCGHIHHWIVNYESYR